MEYKILKQDEVDERAFKLKDTNGDCFLVDIYTDGAFDPPAGADETDDSWRAWLGTFVGKTIEIETITPYKYFSGGETKLINPLAR